MKRWWGRLEKWRRWPAGTATTGDETAPIGGVEGELVTDEGELEFDEDQMAALEG